MFGCIAMCDSKLDMLMQGLFCKKRIAKVRD